MSKDDFFLNNPQVKGFLITTREGEILAESFNRQLDKVTKNEILKKINSIITNGEELAKLLEILNTKRILVETEKFYIILTCSANYILTIIVDRDASLGMTFLNIQSLIYEYENPESNFQVALQSILDLMEKKDEDRLVIERKYMAEIFNNNLWITDRKDGLPKLIDTITWFFKAQGIQISYEGNLIIFLKNNED
ncbi:MAG: hypothetical protein ACTSR8_11945 [Promethearchaeota archaeon]